MRNKDLHLDVLLQNQKFLESIDAHISDRANLGGRRKIILSRINEFLAHTK